MTSSVSFDAGSRDRHGKSPPREQLKVTTTILVCELGKRAMCVEGELSVFL